MVKVRINSDETTYLPKIGSSGEKGINNNLLLLVEIFILLKFAMHLKFIQV